METFQGGVIDSEWLWQQCEMECTFRSPTLLENIDLLSRKKNELMNPMDHLESYSMYIDSSSSKQNNLQGRTPESWVPDDTVKNCFHCKKHFGYGIAGPRNKHHCRLCGRIFCGSCSDKTRCIPTYISKLPIPR